MKVDEIKAYAETMIEACEKGGTLTPIERLQIVACAMSVCGRPFDESDLTPRATGPGALPNASMRGSWNPSQFGA